MDALKRSIGKSKAPAKGKKRKAAAGQKEMLLPISGMRPAKEDRKKVDTRSRTEARMMDV
jgi:DNA end-binding protein Ku